MIDIEDIAHALANKCRYSGHCKTFYSVAQHSVLVSRFCEDKQWGLLHDSGEAYMPDIPSPLKILPEFSFLRKVENNIMEVVCEYFNLHSKEPSNVKAVDQRMLVTEIRDLMTPGSCWEKYFNKYIPYEFEITPWSPRMAKEIFLATAKGLNLC